MKLISRAVGEQVVIDGHVKVTVKQIDDERIVLAIESSQFVPPYREEIIARRSDPQSIPETLTRSSS
ncbi:MAG: carbon storage regulator [Planctomycetaceae bacterium]|nr:carbon storage regulator [Planctomycetaceae bacterium]